jgi:hypothetical protein
MSDCGSTTWRSLGRSSERVISAATEILRRHCLKHAAMHERLLEDALRLRQIDLACGRQVDLAVLADEERNPDLFVDGVFHHADQLAHEVLVGAEGRKVAHCRNPSTQS